MTPDEVFERLKEAAQTLRRVPTIKGPKGHGTHWPEWLRDAKLAYGYDSSQAELNERAMRIQASPEQIDKMDEALGWLQLIEKSKAQFIWARANNQRWGRIATRMGVSVGTARKNVMAYVVDLTKKVND